MRKIINNVLYDTDTAECIYTDNPGIRKYYKTAKGKYFTLYSNGDIQPATESFIKDLLGACDVDKYIELFGEPEEA